MLQFQTETALRQWLLEHGVELSGWGKGAAKTVGDLLAEIQKGESVMHHEPPLRRVSAVQVVVRRDGYVLVEAAQAFDGGRRRTRNRPPSEKLLPGEQVAEAAIRCLQEELNVPPQHIVLQPQSYQTEIVDAASPSYPGLSTRYTLHTVAAQVHGLPHDNFVTAEQATGSGEPVSQHFWEWRKEDE